MKIVDSTIDILESNHIEYTYEQIIDTLWLYSVINSKNTLEESMVECNREQKSQEADISKDDKSPIVESHKEAKEQKDDIDRNINLHLQNQEGFRKTKNPKVPKGEYFRTPTHKQFDKFHKFAKAFKILRELSESQNEYIFDEEATIQDIANTHIWNITLKPKKELKYSLHIIIEQSKSMEIYEEIIKDFLKALKRFTIFKDIDIYYIKEQEYFKLAKDKKFSKFINITSLKSLQKRNFTFILTDCVSPAWGCSIGYKFLKELESVTPFMIINLLPQRVWRRTQLYKSKEFKITHTKGYLNKNLVSSEIIPENIKEHIKVPITTLEYIPLKNWSRVVAKEKNNWLYGAIFEAQFYNIEANTNAKQSSVTAQQLLDNFEAYLSPLAKKLAIYLSCVPLTMDIIKIVQKENLKEANYTHVAEVFLSGLLQKSRYKTKSGDVIYEYKENIQKALFKRLALYKKIEILKHNSSFISNNLGSNINFQALLENPQLESGIELSESDTIFAQILIDVFEEIGGEYANLANELEKSLEQNRENLDNSKEDMEVIIPTSKRFMMGSNDGDNDEKPVHEVIFNYDFEIAKYPVTVGEFRAFIEDTGYITEAENGDGAYVWDGNDWNKKKDAYWDNPYFEQTDDHLVVCVSRHDAKAYCEWLSKKTGENYRLPTEAEWEFACRAGTTTKWSFGDDEKELEKYAWYNENSDYKTHPVGGKLPNPWGLYDMHGNVWEWCEDDWASDYNETPRDGSAHKDKSSSRKVLRGGSWYDDAFRTRCAFRGGSDPDNRNFSVGFRLLRTLPS